MGGGVETWPCHPMCDDHTWLTTLFFSVHFFFGCSFLTHLWANPTPSHADARLPVIADKSSQQQQRHKRATVME